MSRSQPVCHCPREQTFLCTINKCCVRILLNAYYFFYSPSQFQFSARSQVIMPTIMNKPTDSELPPSRPSRDASNRRQPSVDNSLRSMIASGLVLPSSFSHTPQNAVSFPQLQLGPAGSHFSSPDPEEHRQHLLRVLNSALAIVIDVDDLLRGEEAEEEQRPNHRPNDRHPHQSNEQHPRQ